MGMRTNPMFQPQPAQPNAQHQATHLLAQQAHMARLQQAQRNSHVSVSIELKDRLVCSIIVYCI